MALPIDTKAPDFVLKTKGENGLSDVRLSDNFGKTKTVLLFFPLAFTPVCTTELCSVTETLNQYEKLGATVYGISVDSPFTLEVYAQQQGISFPLLSDFNREATRAYDIVCPELATLKEVSKRSAFVIDQEGTIIYSWSSDDAKVLPDFSAIQAALQEVTV